MSNASEAVWARYGGRQTLKVVSLRATVAGMGGSVQCVLALSGLMACALWSPARAAACYGAPEEMVVHHTELVKRTRRIALGRFVGSSPRLQSNFDAATLVRADAGVGWPGGRAWFETLEVLKGDVGKRFSVTFPEAYGGKAGDATQSDFDGHRDRKFWRRAQGRQGYSPDCEMHPRFAVGSVYLMFLDTPYHVRSFERIERTDDWWLVGVRRLVADPRLPTGLAISVPDYLDTLDAVFVGKVLEFHAKDRDRLLNFTEVATVRAIAGVAPTAALGRYTYGRDPRYRSVCCNPGTTVIALLGRTPETHSLIDEPYPIVDVLPLREVPGGEIAATGHVVDFGPLAGESAFVGKVEWTLSEITAYLTRTGPAARP